jgi:hypothetical protein
MVYGKYEDSDVLQVRRQSRILAFIQEGIKHAANRQK